MKKIFALDNHKKILLSAFVILGGLSALSAFSQPEEAAPTSFSPAPASVDTFIPRGYVLVPIELTNSESLSSLLGDVGGVVDLYLVSNDKKPGNTKVGSKLKLLRAPLNPQQYAVLVRDHEGARILGYAGPFVAVVQNPEAQGQDVAAPQPSMIKIEYQN